QAGGRYYIVEIEQRLAHTHENHVGDLAPFLGQSGDCEAQLADDLRYREIAVKPLGRGRAKAAFQGAADLGRDAQRAPVRFGDENRLDGVATVKAQQPLAGSVRGALIEDDLRQPDLAQLAQLGPQGLAEVSHGVKVVNPALMNPFDDLNRPEGLLAELGKEALHRLAIKVEQIQLRR